MTKKTQKAAPVVDPEQEIRELCRTIMARSDELKRNPFNPFTVLDLAPDAGLKNSVHFLRMFLSGGDLKDPKPDPNDTPLSDYPDILNLISILRNNYQRKIDYYVASLQSPTPEGAGLPKQEAAEATNPKAEVN